MTEIAEINPGVKMDESWPAPPSNRANWNVTHTSRPLMLVRWLAVGLAVPALLVVVPLVDLVRASIERVAQLLTARLSIRS